MNVLPSVFISESISKIIHINEYKHMLLGILVTIVIGIALYLFINKANFYRIKNLISLLLITVLGIIGYEILFLIVS